MGKPLDLPGISAADTSTQKERAITIQSALKDLKIEYQQILTAHFWDGKNLSEIAREMGVTPQTIREKVQGVTPN